MKFSISYIVRTQQHTSTGVVQRKVLVVRLLSKTKVGQMECSAHVIAAPEGKNGDRSVFTPSFKETAPSALPALKNFESVPLEVAAQRAHALRMAHEIAVSAGNAALMRGSRVLCRESYSGTASLSPVSLPAPTFASSQRFVRRTR